MEETLETEEQNLADAISPHSIRLSRHVRQLAYDLRDKTQASPYAPDTLILANEVGSLCDYVEHLHGNVESLLAKVETTANSVASSHGDEPSSEEKKAMEIQREIHELHPTVLDTVKALFMWRDSPEQRLRDGK